MDADTVQDVGASALVPAAISTTAVLPVRGMESEGWWPNEVEQKQVI